MSEATPSATPCDRFVDHALTLVTFLPRWLSAKRASSGFGRLGSALTALSHPPPTPVVTGVQCGDGDRYEQRGQHEHEDCNGHQHGFSHFFAGDE